MFKLFASFEDRPDKVFTFTPITVYVKDFIFKHGFSLTEVMTGHTVVGAAASQLVTSLNPGLGKVSLSVRSLLFF